jgi:hypothetical protein
MNTKKILRCNSLLITINILQTMTLNSLQTEPRNIIFFSCHLFDFQFLNQIRSVLITQEIIEMSSFLLDVLNTKLCFVKTGLNKKVYLNKNVSTQQYTQYIRKFSFLFKYFILRHYPNNLLKISTKKIHLLAVKNLYILNNL